jgi:hypothetical protein
MRYRFIFSIGSFVAVLLGFLIVRDWNLGFNWVFFISIPIVILLVYYPFIVNAKYLPGSSIDLSCFGLSIRHFYVLLGHGYICHFLTGY